MIGQFTSAFLKENDNGCLYLVKSDNGTEKEWCYLMVSANKLSIFRKAVAGPGIYPAQYGKIIYSGTGAGPSDEVKRMIQYHYLDKKDEDAS